MSSFTELKVGLHLFMLFGSHADNVAPFSFLKRSHSYFRWLNLKLHLKCRERKSGMSYKSQVGSSSWKCLYISKMQTTASYQQWQLDWFFLHLVFGIYCSYLWTLKSGPLWLVAFYDGWVLETCWLCSIALNWWVPFIKFWAYCLWRKRHQMVTAKYCLLKKLLCSYGLRCQVVCSQV